MDTIYDISLKLEFDDPVQTKNAFYSWLLGPTKSLKHIEMLKSTP